MQAVRMSFPVLDTLQWTSLAIKLLLQSPQISHGAAKTPSQLPLIKNSGMYESANISSFDKMNPWMQDVSCSLSYVSQFVRWKRRTTVL